MNAPASIPVLQRAKLRAADFHLLDRAGAFDGYSKAELIEGEIWVLNAVHVWHSKAMSRFHLALARALAESGSPLQLYLPVAVDLTDDSVPEPDIAVGEDHDNGPLPFAKTRIAIEISDTTLNHDLGRKARMYARAGVPEYWVVAREGARVVQHWLPGPDGYADRRDVPFGERLVSATLPSLSVETAPLA